MALVVDRSRRQSGLLTRRSASRLATATRRRGSTTGRPGRTYFEGPNFTASGDALEPDEVLFAERLVALNERLAWIPKGSDGGDRLGPFPTNDFIWLSHNKLKVEQKALLPETPADAVHIARQIAKATGKNKRRHTVDFVVVDIGERELADDARSKLEAYNLVAVRPVRGLWIMAQGQLHHIVLRS